MTTKSIAILGATSALGQAVARELLQQAPDGQAPLNLVLVARNESRLSEVADDLKARGAQVTCIVADLDDMGGHDALMHSLSDVCDYWFFYGSLPDQEQAEQSWDSTEQALKTNLMSPISLLTRAANALEGAGRGSLVIVTSVAGDRGRKSN